MKNKSRGIYVKKIRLLALLLLTVLMAACSRSETLIKKDEEITKQPEIKVSDPKESDESIQEETNEILKEEAERDEQVVVEPEEQEESVEQDQEHESFDKLLIYDENGYKDIFWQQEYLFDQNKELEVDLNNDGELDLIVVGMDSPNGEKVLVIHKAHGINLMHYISSEMLDSIENLYDEFELKEGNMMQVVLVDFDNDGQEEIVLAIGDGLTTLGVNIFKMDYDSNDLHAKEIGFFQGQEKIHIDKNNNIIIPFGNQGLYEQYKYEKGKFVKAEL